MQSVSKNIHFPEPYRLRAPRGMRAALEIAAKQNNTTASEWVRQALLRELAAYGVHLRDGQVAPIQPAGRRP